MPQIGTNENPAWVRVNSMEKAEAVLDFCNKRGWIIVTAIAPDEPQNLSDLEYLLSTSEPKPVQLKIGRNETCPCGSGKKYKKCCLT